MTGTTHTDPLSAWRYLCKQGGIEIKGRDEGLDRRILQRLDPLASSLEDALLSTDMELFARAFFEAIDPFVAMFRDILDFFKRASATEGQDQWVLRVDGFDLDLENFRRWIETWSHAGRFEEEVPAIDQSGVWKLWDIMRRRSTVADKVSRSFDKVTLDLPRDVQDWVNAYNHGEYLQMPASLTGANCPPELRACGLIAQAALLKLRDLDLNRERLMTLYRSRRGSMDRVDALDFWTIAQNETDIWLRTLIVALSASAFHLDAPDLKALGLELEQFLSKYPSRPFEIDVSIADLESVLSLPIWKQRNELYSVWIGTEIIRALKGHNIELHHDNGRIEFAFHETLIATIHSSSGPFTLISERRRPLLNPLSKDRREGVQPDHSLWTKVSGHEVCKMAVEVKHFKAPAKGKFISVFEDYARSFPDGNVYLVNHGPTGELVYKVSSDISDRCYSIDNLTASNSEGREELAEAVRRCVGEPLLSWPQSTSTVDSQTVLALDVSASMKQLFQSPSVEAFIVEVVAAERPRELVGVDTAIVGQWPATRAGYVALLHSGGGSTDLGESIRVLLLGADRVVLITDQEGTQSLVGLTCETHEAGGRAPANLLVLVCRAASEE
jgi:hypothetical protein